MTVRGTVGGRPGYVSEVPIMRIADSERWALGAILGALAVAANLFLPWFGVGAAAFSASARVVGFDAFWGLAGSVLLVVSGMAGGLAVLLRVRALRERSAAIAAIGALGMVMVVGQIVAGHVVAGVFRLHRQPGALLAPGLGVATLACAILAARRPPAPVENRRTPPARR